MAVKTRAELKAENASDFPDNTARLISAAYLRGQMDDTADSMLMHEDIAGLDVSEANVTAEGSGTKTLAEWTADILDGDGVSQFFPPWEGAISWPVTERMQQQVYLLDFIPQSEHAGIRSGANLPASHGGTQPVYDCSDALEAAIASVSVLESTADIISGVPGAYLSGPEIIFPYGHCYFSRTIELKRKVILTGAGGGGPNPHGTRLLFAAGITGIVVNFLDTFEGGRVPGTQGGNNSVIRNLKIVSMSAGVPFPDDVTNGYEYGLQGYPENHWVGHGIWARAICHIEQCMIQHFPRCGLYVVAAAVTTRDWFYGNANLLYASHLALYTNGACGLYVDGPDTNGCTFIGINANANRLSGIYESSLAGNFHAAHHVDQNQKPAMCSYISDIIEGDSPTGAPAISRRYILLDDTRASGFARPWLASTVYFLGQYVANAGNLYKCDLQGTTAASGGPTGTGANIVDGTARWDWWAAEGTKIPPTGHAESGAVWQFIQNSGSGVNVDAHDWFPPWPYTPAYVLPGDTTVGTGDTTPKRYERGHPYWFPQVNGTGNVIIGCYTEASQPSSFAGGVVIGGMPLANDTQATHITSLGNIGPTITVNSALGSARAFTTNLSRQADESITWLATGDHSSGLSFLWEAAEGTWSYQWARTTTPMQFTTNLSTLTGGRAAVIPGGRVLFGKDGLWLGSTPTAARNITNSIGVAPTTGQWAAGDLVLNAAPLLGEPWGWRCILTGDFAATPPVFQPLRDLGSQQTVATNADSTLTPGTSTYHTKHTGTLTADRAATLSKTGALIGLSYKITRTGGGAFNLNVLNGAAGPTLKALTTNTWGEFAYDGTDYYLAAYGAL